MRSRLARGSSVLRAGTILGKRGPIEFIRYIMRGLYNHRHAFLAAFRRFRVLFGREPRETVKAIWLLSHHPSWEKYQLLYQVMDFFGKDPVMAKVAFDLAQKRRANRVWRQVKDRSSFSVLFITTIGETLSARYQVDNLCEQLGKQGIQTCILFTFEIHKHLEEVLGFDIVVFHRLILESGDEDLLSQARERMVALVFETDDYLFDTSVILSQDSLKHASPERLAQVASYSTRLREMLLACDYFIGTTATLADAATDLGRTSFVIRNGLSDRQLTLAEEALKRCSHQSKADDILRIGYQPGTLTHRQDFAVALPALIRILAEFPQVKLVIQGLLEIPETLQSFQKRIERWPFVSWEKLIEMTTQLDMAIAPLEVLHPWNEAKSALKYFESGLVEVPMVASPTEDFCKAIQDGVNGFLANTEEEWYESLKKLINDRSLRRQMGMAARQDVLAHYTSTAQSTNTLAVFQTILQQNALRRGQRMSPVASTGVEELSASSSEVLPVLPHSADET